MSLHFSLQPVHEHTGAHKTLQLHFGMLYPDTPMYLSLYKVSIDVLNKLLVFLLPGGGQHTLNEVVLVLGMLGEAFLTFSNKSFLFYIVTV